MLQRLVGRPVRPMSYVTIPALPLWGSDAYALIDEQHRDSKLAERAVHGIYIGHDESSPSILVFVPRTKKVIRSADVTITENIDHLLVSDPTVALLY